MTSTKKFPNRWMRCGMKCAEWLDVKLPGGGKNRLWIHKFVEENPKLNSFGLNFWRGRDLVLYECVSCGNTQVCPTDEIDQHPVVKGEWHLSPDEPAPSIKLEDL